VVGEGFERGSVAEAGVQPLAVVEDFDVVRDGEAGPGAGGEPVVVKHLVLQGGEEALSDRVVPADPGPAYAGVDENPLAVLVKVPRRVLRSAVGMKRRIGLNIPTETCHRQGVDDQTGPHVIGHLPAYDHPGRQIDHRREVEPALTRPQVSDVADQSLTGRAAGGEVPTDQIWAVHWVWGVSRILDRFSVVDQAAVAAVRYSVRASCGVR